MAKQHAGTQLYFLQQYNTELQITPPGQQDTNAAIAKCSTAVVVLLALHHTCGYGAVTPDGTKAASYYTAAVRPDKFMSKTSSVYCAANSVSATSNPTRAKYQHTSADCRFRSGKQPGK